MENLKITLQQIATFTASQMNVLIEKAQVIGYHLEIETEHKGDYQVLLHITSKVNKEAFYELVKLFYEQADQKTIAVYTLLMVGGTTKFEVYFSINGIVEDKLFLAYQKIKETFSLYVQEDVRTYHFTFNNAQETWQLQ